MSLLLLNDCDGEGARNIENDFSHPWAWPLLWICNTEITEPVLLNSWL